jgi:hypothetical protein
MKPRGPYMGPFPTNSRGGRLSTTVVKPKKYYHTVSFSNELRDPTLITQITEWQIWEVEDHQGRYLYIIHKPKHHAMQHDHSVFYRVHMGKCHRCGEKCPKEVEIAYKTLMMGTKPMDYIKDWTFP